MALGSTTLALDGQIDERLNLRFTLSAQDLSLVSPGSRGRIKASGTLGGTLSDPAVVGVVHAVGVDYEGIKLEAADADVDFEPDAIGKESKIDARLRGLSYGQHTLQAATLTLTGPPSAYLVHVTATAPGLAASVQARGAYAHESFQGQLTALSLNGSEALHLTLERPVNLLAALDHVHIEWLRLVGTPGSVCADGEWRPAEWATTIMSNELPLSTLTAGTTPDVQYLGTLSALARLSGGATTVQGSLRAQLAEAQIAHRLASRKIEHTRIGSGSVDVTLEPQLVRLEANLGDGEVGTMHMNLSAQRTTATLADMPLAGEIHAQSAQLGLVSLYVPEIDRASGHFTTDLRVGGTLGAPTPPASSKASEGEIDVYQVNLALRQIELEAHVEGRAQLQGRRARGQRTVRSDGHLEWHDLLPDGKFHLQGTNLRVADIPEA